MKIKLFLASLIVIVFLSLQIPAFFNQKTLFIFCDVGEGDGALLITPENVFLIDAGRDNRITDCLERHLPFWRREITGAIITHPDADHINGLNSVMQSYRLKWLFSNFTPNKTGEYRKIYDALVNSGVVVKSFVAGEKINVVGGDLRVAPHADKPGGLSLQIQSLWPLNQHKEYESTNLFSTISVVTIGASKFLMLADAEIPTQIAYLPEIKKRGAYLTVKLSHHGSSKNFSYTLLRELSPKYATISVGQNSYGHPAKKAIDLLKSLNTIVPAKAGIQILRTDQMGDVVFECEKRCVLKQ